MCHQQKQKHMLPGSGVQIPKEGREGVAREGLTNLLVGDGLVLEWLGSSEDGFDDLVSEMFQLWHKMGNRSVVGAKGKCWGWHFHHRVQKLSPLKSLPGHYMLSRPLYTSEGRTEGFNYSSGRPARPNSGLWPVCTRLRPSKEPLAANRQWKVRGKERSFVIAKLAQECKINIEAVSPSQLCNQQGA